MSNSFTQLENKAQQEQKPRMHKESSMIKKNPQVNFVLKVIKSEKLSLNVFS